MVRGGVPRPLSPPRSGGRAPRGRVRSRASALPSVPGARPLLRHGPPLDPAGRSGRASRRSRLLRSAPRPRAAAGPPYAPGPRRHAGPSLSGLVVPDGRQLLHELRLLPHGAENRAVIEEIERVLQPGGASSADTFGRDHVLARLVSEERCSRGGKEYRIRRSWDSSTSASRRRSRSAGPAPRRFSARASGPYSADELVAMLDTRGLRVGSVWGDFDESPVGARIRRG